MKKYLVNCWNRPVQEEPVSAAHLEINDVEALNRSADNFLFQLQMHLNINTESLRFNSVGQDGDKVKITCYSQQYETPTAIKNRILMGEKGLPQSLSVQTPVDGSYHHAILSVDKKDLDWRCPKAESSAVVDTKGTHDAVVNVNG